MENTIWSRRIKVCLFAALAGIVLALLISAIVGRSSELSRLHLLEERIEEKLSSVKQEIQKGEAELKQLNSEADLLREARRKVVEERNGIINKGIDNPNVSQVGNFISTENGGIDEFLKVNGAEFVKEAGDMFRAAGLLHNIKPEVLVCIAQADSSLGNNLKSSNNIGNVGNNDSGNIRHYDSLGQAIDGISAALNNQYLKGDMVIGHLSQGGRNVLKTKYDCTDAPSPYKCYASSSFNWNNNTKLCLQDILQDSTIDETLEFRL